MWGGEGCRGGIGEGRGGEGRGGEGRDGERRSRDGNGVWWVEEEGEGGEDPVRASMRQGQTHTYHEVLHQGISFN